MKSKLIALTGLLILMALGSVSLQEPTLISRKIELIGPAIDKIVPVDIDGDGIQELVIQQNKELLIYQPATPTVATSLQQVSRFTLPDDIFMWQIANLIGEAPMELVVLTDKGVSFYPWSGSGFINGQARQDILELTTIFRDTLNTAPLSQRFLFDLNDDKLLDIIIPAQNKLILVMQTEPGQFKILQEIPIKTSNNVKTADTLFESHKTEIAFPLIFQARINQDENTDLVLFRKGFIYIYLRSESGEYVPGAYPAIQATTGQHELFLGLGKQERKKDGDFSYELAPLLADINGNGLTDIVISDTSEDATAIYLNKTTQVAPFTPGKPDIIKRVNGWLIDHELIDLNHDQLLDLVILQMKKVGILSGLQVLLAHEVNWEMSFYLAHRREGKIIYEKSPNYRKTLTVPFKFSINPSLLEFQTPLLLSLRGDFNGDNLKDFLLREKPGGPMLIFYGKHKATDDSADISLNLYAEASYLPENIPYGQPIITDLDTNGRDDIIIHQSMIDAANHKHHLIEIFIY